MEKRANKTILENVVKRNIDVKEDLVKNIWSVYLVRIPKPIETD